MFHVEHLFSVFLSLTTFYVEHFSLPFSHNVPRGTFLSAFLSQRSTWNISLCLSLTTFYVEHFPLPFSHNVLRGTFPFAFLSHNVLRGTFLSAFLSHNVLRGTFPLCLSVTTFHVEHYLRCCSRYTNSTEISAGETPEIRDACPIEDG